MKILYTLSLAIALVTSRADAQVVSTLNGLKITVDEQSGAILGLEFPGPGRILQAAPDRAGLVDMAYPIPEFEPLRLASRFSKNARIEASDDSLVISLDALGPSRDKFSPAGNVSVVVSFRAMPDGRTITLQCEIENNSDRPIPQVLFPDFHGLLPVGGKEGTYLRSAGFVRRPFVDVGMTDYPEFYALDDRTRPIDRRDTYLYTGGTTIGNGDRMVGRWLDYGSLQGGLSIFPKQWTGDPATSVRIFRMQKDPNVRLTHIHTTKLGKGEKWKSPEFVLTPHQDGWARGIETYRAFVRSKIDRMFPIPEHVRKGLGFRTAIVGLREPNDEEGNVAFRAADLPALAAECKQHGLDEIMLWAWRLPFIAGAPPFADFGSPEQLSAAMKQCREIDVNVAMFITVYSVSETMAARYGVKVGKSGWTYHPEFIPRFNPSYAHAHATGQVDTTNELWQKDVMEDVRNLFEKYTRSIGWDQASPGTEVMFRKFLPLAKSKDPKATFAGEATQSVERLSDWLDYTWNWEIGSYHHNLMSPYRDMRGFISSFPAPRLNYNINHNAQHVKYAFMDNFYVNVMPSAPDSANATGWIKDDPALSQVLKQCAKLREQFLPYFLDGTLIGECLLTRPENKAHINAYVLPDRVLLMVMNTQEEPREIELPVNLAPWLKSTSGRYYVQAFDQPGKTVGPRQRITADWSGKTPSLANFDLAFYEFTVENP